MATASDPNVLALQTAVSRFSGVIPQIGEVTADGVMSSQLVSNVQAALAYIAANDNTVDAGGSQTQAQDAATLALQVGTTSSLQSAASGVANTLNMGADDLGLGGSDLNIVPAGIPGAQQANQLISAIYNMPTWAKIVGGLAAAAVVFGVYHAVARKKRRGFRDYDYDSY